jgi:hypothetical protein
LAALQPPLVVNNQEGTPRSSTAGRSTTSAYISFHDTAALNPTSVQVRRLERSATRKRCTPSAKPLYVFNRFGDSAELALEVVKVEPQGRLRVGN